MGKEDEEKNAYEVVGVGSDATDTDIKKAFRQRSLKTHPDRNPHLKDAARLFHELTQAYELLLDPLRRMALDAKLRIQEARKQRYANFDKKRKAMLEELEEAERADREAKSAEATKKQRYAQEAEQIRDAGRRMVEERQAELRRQREEVEQAEKSAQDELEPPPLGEHDTTVRLKYPLAKYPQLTTPGALHTFMTSTFGPVDGDSIVLSMKPPKKKASAAAAAAATEQKPAPPKYAIAAVPFKTIADAHAAVCASRRADRGLDEFEISWMGGCEPAVWSWAERMLKLKEERGATVPATPAPADGARDVGDDAPASGLSPDSGASSSPATGAQFSSFPSSFSGPPPPLSSAPRFSAPGLDFESAVLMRMRQAERERLEREIREQEASET
ncbi:DnaJ-domain-containing protein [Russula ochroleuca]|jgi:DnaJ family protein C protein 17|uniref:DnaJ-domain-containing protein n=1 Tax=Russula ochroleuca TaxID=152965 RepID=A0A9P5TBV2_9AGAM|nr:DnaJ-domain-containing protein [Russula ochroleuca]